MQRDSWQLEQTRILKKAMGSEEATGVEESMMRTPWTGCGTALVTPFTREGAVDEAGVRRLARRQIEAGIHFLVPCGTTGENPTLTPDEKERILAFVVVENRATFLVQVGRDPCKRAAAKRRYRWIGAHFASMASLTRSRFSQACS
jgi:4-hydroxy-tetrahydrodipicolinate synthase